MKLLLDKNLTGLDGVELSNNQLGKFLGVALCASKGLDALKVMIWAPVLHSCEVLELDEVDYDKLYKEVETVIKFNPEHLHALIKGQILQEMKRQKEVSEKKGKESPTVDK